MLKWMILIVVAISLVTMINTLSQVWVGHIPKKYNYNPDLPAPNTIMAWTNMNCPMVQKGMLHTISERKEEVANVQAPEGFALLRENVTVDGGEIALFCLEPSELKGQKDVPVLFYIHGGAFYFPLTVGDIDSMKYYAKELGAKVFMPDYRTSLEHPFPVPFLDCYAAINYVAEKADEFSIDMSKLIIYGNSAGGALAAGLAQYIRDFGGPIAKAQVLVFPVMDNSMNYKSVQEYEDAPWSKSSNEHMWSVYLANGDNGMLKYAAPMQSDDFTNLPSAYVEPSEMDILRDEALAYAKKLEENQTKVETYVVPGGYHGFDADQTNPLVKQVINRRIAFMKSKMK